MSAKAFTRVGRYSPELTRALLRLDALVDWERRNRVQGAVRLMRVSAQPAQALLHRLGVNLDSFQSVHVTGSKGKGSVCALIAAGIGLDKTGVLASPHVERVNERVRISGNPIEDDLLASALQRALDAREKEPLLEKTTWFDVMTVAALDEFARQKMPFAILEAGMGARRDSTSVVSAKVGVVTNVMFEHANIIGPTIRDIAHEKAGVIRPGSTLILGMAEDDSLAEVFRAEAKSVEPNARIVYVPPCGGIRAHNFAIASAALEALGVDSKLKNESQVDTALMNLPARQEWFKVGVVSVLLDGAHVADSVSKVLSEAEFKGKIEVVLGVGADKDIKAIGEVLLADSRVDRLVATEAGAERTYMRATSVGEKLVEIGFKKVVVVEKAEEATEEAIRMATDKGSDVVVIGSLHLAGRVRPVLRQRSQT